MPQATNYADLRIGLRAPRVAVITDGGEHWRYWLRHAAHELTSTWGGLGFILIPHINGTVHDELLKAAVAYDPDYVVLSRKTIGQWEIIEPGAVRFSDEFGKDASLELRTEIVARSRENFVSDFKGMDARDLVARYCSSYRRELGSGTLDEDITFIDGPEVSGRLPMIDFKPDDRMLAAPPTWDGSVGTLAALWLGMTQPPAPGNDFNAHEDTSITKALEWLLLHGTGLAGPPPGVLALSGSDSIDDGWTTALNASASSLVWVASGMQQGAPVTIVVGDTANDLCLALAYRTVYGSAYWMPSEWSVLGEDSLSLVSRRAFDLLIESASRLGQTFDLVSTTRSDEELDKIQVVLSQNQRADTYSSITVDGVEEPMPQSSRSISIGSPNWPLKGKRHLAVSEQYDNRVALPVVADDKGGLNLATTPPSPMMSDISLARKLKWSWQVDVQFMDSGTPVGSGLPGDIFLDDSEDPYLTWVRSGRDGLSYQSRRWNFIVAGTPPELQLARPRLRDPGLAAWVDRMAAAGGFETRPSDAGRRAQLLGRLWGSRERMSSDLAGPLLPALRAFNFTGKSTKEAYPMGGGAYVASLGGFLEFSGFAHYWGAESAETVDIRDQIDFLAEQGILRRGLLLICQECMRPDFKGVIDLSQVNKCLRCGAHSQLSRSAWKQPIGEPTWHYDLHPAARELIDQNGVEPILLSHALRQRAKYFSDLTEFEMIQGGKSKIELDLVAHMDGRVLVAEVKTTDSLGGNNSERIASVQRRLEGAQLLKADEIIFATSKSAWSAASVSTIKQETKDRSWVDMFPPRITLLTALGTSDPESVSIY